MYSLPFVSVITAPSPEAITTSRSLITCMSAKPCQKRVGTMCSKSLIVPGFVAYQSRTGDDAAEGRPVYLRRRGRGGAPWPSAARRELIDLGSSDWASSSLGGKDASVAA